FDPEKRPDIDRALPADLLKEPVQQRAGARQAPERRREAVERLVGFVAMVLDPLLNFLQAAVDELAGFIQLCRIEGDQRGSVEGIQNARCGRIHGDCLSITLGINHDLGLKVRTNTSSAYTCLSTTSKWLSMICRIF